jgi:stringent starvation protein B
MQEISTKPYLLRALYEWCTDNGFTPHIAVKVDSHTRVPREFVRNGEIVLNISFDATSQLQMTNDYIEFLARFSGKSHKIEVPVSNVLAIYARENGQGMAFPIDGTPAEESAQGGTAEFETLEADDFYDVTPEEKEKGLQEKAEQGAEPTEDAAADAGKSSPGKNGERKHLKVIK